MAELSGLLNIEEEKNGINQLKVKEIYSCDI